MGRRHRSRPTRRTRVRLDRQRSRACRWCTAVVLAGVRVEHHADASRRPPRAPSAPSRSSPPRRSTFSDPALCRYRQSEKPHYGENSRDLTPSRSHLHHGCPGVDHKGNGENLFFASDGERRGVDMLDRPRGEHIGGRHAATLAVLMDGLRALRTEVDSMRARSSLAGVGLLRSGKRQFFPTCCCVAV